MWARIWCGPPWPDNGAQTSRSRDEWFLKGTVELHGLGVLPKPEGVGEVGWSFLWWGVM